MPKFLQKKKDLLVLLQLIHLGLELFKPFLFALNLRLLTLFFSVDTCNMRSNGLLCSPFP